MLMTRARLSKLKHMMRGCFRSLLYIACFSLASILPTTGSTSAAPARSEPERSARFQKNCVNAGSRMDRDVACKPGLSSEQMRRLQEMENKRPGEAFELVPRQRDRSHRRTQSETAPPRT